MKFHLGDKVVVKKESNWKFKPSYRGKVLFVNHIWAFSHHPIYLLGKTKTQKALYRAYEGDIELASVKVKAHERTVAGAP